MPESIQRMREHAPNYVRWILEKSRAFPEVRSLAEVFPGSIELLDGGNMSAIYTVRTEKTFAVIKLRRDGVDAEEESLNAWAAKGVRVPTVRKKGSLPAQNGSAVKYLVLDFVVDRKGGRAPTGASYLEKNPGRARRLGQLLGRTLARMHRAKSSRTFGEFADTSGANTAPLKSWNRYLWGYIRLHEQYLLGLGISRRLIAALVKTIEEMQFAPRGTYLHGDYSPRNVMLSSSVPLKLVVFDPNPLIGDPSWDIAILFNNRDFKRKRYEWEPTNPDYRKAYQREQRVLEGFWTSYRRASTETVTLEKIRLAQLIQTIIHLQTEERKRSPKRSEHELETRVRREALFQRFGSITLKT